MKTKVTLGLCVKNCAKIVQTAFDSISIQDYPHELIKLVIVDNGSSDNTLSLAMKFAHETDVKTFVTSSKGKGLAATRQISVDNAEGDYIVWVDDDLVFSKNLVRNQVEFMEKNPHVGAANCVSIRVANQNIISILEYATLLFSQPQNRKSFGTGASIFRLKALESVGGFDIRIEGAGEDIDITNRLRLSGWALSTNNSTCYQQKYPPATLKDLWKKQSWYGYGRHFLFHKYRNARLLMDYFPPLTFWIGFKTSYLLYRLINKRNVFAYIILHYFSKIAEYSGFIHAHLEKYGHANCT